MLGRTRQSAPAYPLPPHSRSRGCPCAGRPPPACAAALRSNRRPGPPRACRCRPLAALRYVTHRPQRWRRLTPPRRAGWARRARPRRHHRPAAHNPATGCPACRRRCPPPLLGEPARTLCRASHAGDGDRPPPPGASPPAPPPQPAGAGACPPRRAPVRDVSLQKSAPAAPSAPWRPWWLPPAGRIGPPAGAPSGRATPWPLRASQRRAPPRGPESLAPSLPSPLSPTACRMQARPSAPGCRSPPPAESSPARAGCPSSTATSAAAPPTCPRAPSTPPSRPAAKSCAPSRRRFAQPPPCWRPATP
mmetsp:Transcript_15057/g.38717  ORF Transcript_15057/g.38717 Transcript_15057/m.38717 type:complete len:305 (+) Transcript_15057:740-1654(+)